jgi:hypothetical protein
MLSCIFVFRLLCSKPTHGERRCFLALARADDDQVVVAVLLLADILVNQVRY